MARIIVTADSGRVVDTAVWKDGTSPFARDINSALMGTGDAPAGWLGRALRDAAILQEGGDPERPSERAMRLAVGSPVKQEMQED